MVGRILGIDFGLKRIGLAISDPLGITAQPLETLHRTQMKQDLQKIRAIIEEREVEKIVIGLPLNMNGSEGFMVATMRSFTRELKDFIGLEIIEIDERLTSQQAGQALQSAAVKGKHRKKSIDTISAQIILQTYLNSIDR